MSFERVLERSAVAACAVLTSSVGNSAAVERYVLQERRTTNLAPRAVAHDAYRTLKAPPRYIVVHRWHQLADLERFRRDTSQREDRRLSELGATLERFTGALVAQYPLDDASST